MLHYLAKHLGDRFWGSGTSLSRALGEFVGTSTNGALSLPLLYVALGYNVPNLLASIAPSNTVVWIRVVENGHLDMSPSTGWERDYSPNNPRCFNKGGQDGGVMRACRDWVDKVILAVQLLVCITDFQPLFTEVQLRFYVHQFLHDLHDASLGIFHQLLQGILEIAQAPVAVNFPEVLRVVYLGERHVNGKLPVAPIPQMPPLDRAHGGMSGDPLIDEDGARPSFGTDTSTPLYMSIIGGVLDVGGHNEPFLGPVGLVGTVFWVPDIDAVVKGMVGDVINEPWRRGEGLIFFIGLFWVIVVDLGVLVVVVLSHGQRATS